MVIGEVPRIGLELNDWSTVFKGLTVMSSDLSRSTLRIRRPPDTEAYFVAIFWSFQLLHETYHILPNVSSKHSVFLAFKVTFCWYTWESQQDVFSSLPSSVNVENSRMEYILCHNLDKAFNALYSIVLFYIEHPITQRRQASLLSADEDLHPLWGAGTYITAYFLISLRWSPAVFSLK